MAEIRHIAIMTDNPKELADYYADVFGMKITKSMPQGTWITDGVMDVALLLRKAEQKPGINHWGFTVSSEEKAKILAKLDEMGMPAETINQPHRPYIEEKVTDIDGNRFDLSSTGVRATPVTEGAVPATV